MKLLFRRFIAYAALLMCHCIASGAEYGFPTSLRIGAGINPAAPIESFPYCFDYKTRLVPGSASGTSFRATLIHDRKEFLRELNVSASASGTYAFFSAAGSAALDEHYSFDSDSVTWVVQFQSDLGRTEVYDEALKAEFADLLRKNRHADFATRCGTELVTQEQRHISVAAVYSMRNLTAEQKSTIEAKLEGGATAAVWSAKASANYRSFVDEASKSSKINVEIVTVGGPGPAELAPLFTDLGDLEQVSAILRSYASKITFDNSRATSYSTTKMSRYGWNGDSLNSGIANISIGDYYLIFRDTEAIKQRAYGLLQQNAAGVVQLTAPQSEGVKAAYKDSDTLLRRIITTARACREDEKKCTPASSFPTIKASWPKIEPVGSISQESKDVTCKAIGIQGEPQLPFECQQVVRFLVFARWAEVAGIEVSDQFGQRITPLIGDTISMSDGFVRAKAKFGNDLSEEKFLHIETGESALGGIQDAAAKGWTGRVISLRFLFGSHSLQTTGIRTTLNFALTTTTGLAAQRQAYMY